MHRSCRRRFSGVCGAFATAPRASGSRRLRATTRWDAMRPQLKLIAGCVLTAMLGLAPALAQPNGDKTDNKTDREPAAKAKPASKAAAAKQKAGSKAPAAQSAAQPSAAAASGAKPKKEGQAAAAAEPKPASSAGRSA